MSEDGTTTTEVSVVNADGTFAEKWSEKYGEENQPHLSRYKDFDSFVESHISQRKKFSKDPSTLVEIPTGTSSDEVKAAFRKARGVPDSVDAYEYKLSDELAVKLGPLDDKKMLAFKEFAHKQEWSPTQFKDALDFYHANIATDIDTSNISFNELQKAAYDRGMAILKREYRDGIEDKILLANAISRKYGEISVKNENGEMVNPLEELYKESPELKKSPWLTMIFNNIANAMSESTLKGLAPSAPTSGDLQAKITEIRDQMDKIMKENPANFKANLTYKELVERKRALYEQKNKQKSA